MRKLILSSTLFAMALSPVLALPTLVAQQPAGTETAAESTQANAPRIPLTVDIGAAVGILDVDGNEQRYLQYVTPPDGIYINRLAVNSLSPDTSFDLSAIDLGETSQRGGLHLFMLGGGAVLDGQARNSRYYRDFTAAGTPYERRDGSYELKVPAGSGELQMFYDTVSLDNQGPSPLEDWTRSVPGVRYLHKFNGMLAGVGYDQESFTFREGPQFSGQAQNLRFSFSPRRTERTSIQADAALMQTFFETRQGKEAGSKLSLRGVHLLNDNLALTGELAQDEITETIIRNAYAKRDVGGDMALEYRGLPRTTVEVGGGRHRIDYVNDNQTLLTPVDENSLFARATARLTPQVRLRVIQNRTWTDDAPPALDAVGRPYESLVWSNRKDFRTELSLAPGGGRVGLTGRLRRVAWENDSLGSNNKLRESSLYGWWMPRDNMTLYATFLRQNFELNNVGSNPLQYVTDNDTLVYGGSYRFSPKMLVDLALTDTNARGGTGVDERNLWLGASYALTSGARLGLRASIGDFETTDSAPLLNNDHRWFELSLTNLHY